MMAELLTPQGLLVLLIGSALSALIPALVLKLLMSAVFRRTVRYLLVLLGVTISVFALALIGLYMGVTDEAAVEAMPPLQTGMLVLGGFVVQAAILTFVSPDVEMEFIAIWKWGVVLVLQYVVYFLIGLLIAFIMMGSQAAGAAAFNLSRMV